MRFCYYAHYGLINTDTTFGSHKDMAYHLVVLCYGLKMDAMMGSTLSIEHIISHHQVLIQPSSKFLTKDESGT